MGAMPGYWRDEQSDLPGAVEAFFNFVVGEGPEPTANQLSRIQWYCHYFIHAPCWDQNPYMQDDGKAELEMLRERSKTLASVESIRRWIDEAMEIGIAPF